MMGSFKAGGLVGVVFGIPMGLAASAFEVNIWVAFLLYLIGMGAGLSSCFAGFYGGSD